VQPGDWHWSWVSEVVDAIVDAFCAFLEWVVDFITDTIEAIIGPIAQAINDLWTSYWQGVSAALSRMESDYIVNGAVSSQSLNQLRAALNGGLFTVILGITAVICILLIILTVVTNVFSFLLGAAFSMLAIFLFEQAFNQPVPCTETDAHRDMTYGSYDNISVSTMEGVIQLAESDHPPCGSEEAYRRNVLFNVIGAAIGVFGAHVGIAALGKPALKVGFIAGAICIVAALLAAALAIPGSITGDELLGCAALFFGIVSIGAGIMALRGAGTLFEKCAGVSSIAIGVASLVFSLMPLAYEPEGG